MNIIERAVRATGHGTRSDDAGIVYVSDPGQYVQNVAQPGPDLFSGAWYWLRAWMCRVAQPTNTIMPIEASLADVRFVHGYDESGMQTSNGLMANQENVIVRDAFPFDWEWSEVELVVERVKSPVRLLSAVEAGVPVPAWMLRNRWGEVEAGWFVFRPNSLISIYEPKSRAESKGFQQRTERPLILPEEAAQLAEARTWRDRLRETIGAEPMKASPRRAGLEGTFTYPLLKGAELLLLHTGHSARSRGFFAGRVQSATQRMDGEVAAQSEAQRQRGTGTKGDSSRTNLERANRVRSQQIEGRMRALCELRRGNPDITQSECARALGCDPRTIRTYLASLRTCENRSLKDCAACWIR